MIHYLIEFRFHGYAKKFGKSLIYEVARKFRVRGVTRRRVVPHITLFGSFATRYEEKMVSEVVNVGRKYTLVPFRVKGFNYFDETRKVIYLNIDPSTELEELRWEIAKRLLKTTKTKSNHDKNRKFQFHATIADKDIDRKFSEIWNYVIKSKEELNINQHLLRITILRSGRILYEYDLILKKLLNRRQALSKYWWGKTINKLRELQGLPPERQLSLLDWLRKIFRQH